MNAPHVLIVGGSDSSGGAGISRDIETMAEIGVRTCLAVTAVTVQTYEAVLTVQVVGPDLVAAQMQAAFDANPVVAVKIGMLAGEATIAAVADVLRRNPAVPVILDPVLASSSGRLLLPIEAVGCLKRELLPLCDLATPNLVELGVMTGSGQAGDEAEILRQARTLRVAGFPRCAILVKGGHGEGECSTDILLNADLSVERFVARRIDVALRGTGCMLSSAIAAHRALGKPLAVAVALAKDHVFGKLSNMAVGARG